MRNTIKNIWHREREGSSLVTVIIGILFIAAIGTILLTIASRYLISVNVDHNASDNFYQTEGILEEVKTGLLEYAGDAEKKLIKMWWSITQRQKTVCTKLFPKSISVCWHQN